MSKKPTFGPDFDAWAETLLADPQYSGYSKPELRSYWTSFYGLGGGEAAKPKEPGIMDRLLQGGRDALSNARLGAATDPDAIAGEVATSTASALPPSDAQRQMAQEIAPAQQAYAESEGYEAVGKFASLAAQRLAQFARNPREFAGMVAQNLPNSLPGLAGGVGGAVAGSVAGPAGTFAGATAGGTAGGYLIERGDALRTQILREAEARGIDPRDPQALAPLVREKYQQFAESANLKGIGTAGMDAVLNALTLGVAGMGERTLVREARALTEGAKAGTISREAAEAGLKDIARRQAERGTLGAKAARGAGVTAAEVAGEGGSEGFGQLLAYGQVDALDAIDEALIGGAHGPAMAAGRGILDKAVSGNAGSPGAVDQAIGDAQRQIGQLRAQQIIEQDVQAGQRTQQQVQAVMAAGSIDEIVAAATGAGGETPAVFRGADIPPGVQAPASSIAQPLGGDVETPAFARAGRQIDGVQPLAAAPGAQTDAGNTEGAAAPIGAPAAAGGLQVPAEGSVPERAGQVFLDALSRVSPRAFEALVAATQRLTGANDMRSLGAALSSRFTDRAFWGELAQATGRESGTVATAAYQAMQLAAKQAPALQPALIHIKDAAQGLMRTEAREQRVPGGFDNRWSVRQKTREFPDNEPAGSVEDVTLRDQEAAQQLAGMSGRPLAATETAKGTRLQPVDADSDAAAVEELKASIAGGAATFQGQPTPIAAAVASLHAVPDAKLPGIALARAFAQKLGRRVVVVDSEGEAAPFNGAVVSHGTKGRANGVLFLHAKTRRPAVAVVGHELLHTLAPELRAKLAKALAPMIGEAKIAERMQLGLSREAAIEEVMADIVGNRFAEASFWRFLEKKNPGLFREFAQRAIEVLGRILEAMKQGLGLFGADEGLSTSQLRRARVTIANVLAEHARSLSPEEQKRLGWNGEGRFASNNVAIEIGGRDEPPARKIGRVEPRFDEQPRLGYEPGARGQQPIALGDGRSRDEPAARVAGRAPVEVPQPQAPKQLTFEEGLRARSPIAMKAKVEDEPAARVIGRAEVDVGEVNTSPSEAQKEAGNYKKGHVSFEGLDISVENPAGSERNGKDRSGKPWSVEMSAHYGYVKRTEGADGDQIDVYLVERPIEGAPVYVFDQYERGRFDEHKVVLGVATRREAEVTYDAHFSDGSGPKRRLGMRQMSMAEFKEWLKNGDTTKPVAKKGAVFYSAEQREQRAGEPRTQFSVDQSELRKLGPAGASFLKNKKGWAILTAENPNAQPASPEDNARAMAKLKADLDERGVTYINVTGKYGAEENSLIVIGDIDPVDFARRYNQEAVLMPHGFVYQDGSVQPARGVQVFKDKPEDFFTEMPGHTYFQVDIDWDAPRQGGAQFSRELEPAQMFERMAKVADPDLREVFSVWGEGRKERSKAAFMNWLASDEPFDPSKYGKQLTVDGTNWYSQIQGLRVIAGLRDADETKFSREQTGVELTAAQRRASLERDLYGEFELQHDLPRFANQAEFGAFLNRRIGTDKFAGNYGSNAEKHVAGLLAHESILALRQDKNAAHWYRDSIEGAMREAAKLYPEIGAGGDARFIFSMALALTSNGQAIADNVRMAFDAYDAWDKDGKFSRSVEGAGERTSTINAGLRRFNEMVAWAGSVRTLRQFLLSKRTVREIEDSLEMRISGENKDSVVYGGAVFGPKVGGGFLPNLNGLYDALTIDRWLARTYNRLTGNMLDARGQIQNGPRNGSEREFLRGAFARAVGMVREQGWGVDVADMQALLWYPEKELYAKYGVSDVRAAPTDYHQEARRHVEQHQQKRGRSTARQKPGGGRAAADVADRQVALFSAETDGPGRVGAANAPYSRRQPAEGSVAVEGVHWGKRDGLSWLSGTAYGSGLKGAERERLAHSQDARIKRRVYFYVARPDGTLPLREAGVGPFKYTAAIGNLYDPRTGSAKISAADANGFEAAVLDAGFDGYLAPDMGMAVVLDSDVPVTGHGMAADEGVVREVPKGRAKIALLASEIRRIDELLPRIKEIDQQASYRMGSLSVSQDAAPEVRRLLGVPQLQAAPQFSQEFEFNDLDEFDVADPYVLDLTQHDDLKGPKVVPEQADRHAARRWLAMAKDERLFASKTSQDTELENIAWDVGQLRATKWRPADPVERVDGATRAALITMPRRGKDDEGAHATVLKNNKGEVWVNAVLLRKGAQEGSLVYPIVAAYAHNNGLKFIGDPAGLSDAAVFRRTEQMLASALRFGTTDHIAPHQRQLDAGLAWRDGDTEYNIAAMLAWSRAKVLDAVPALYELGYDPATGQITDSQGEVIDAAGLRALLDAAGGREVNAGRRTAARTVATNEFVAEYERGVRETPEQLPAAMRGVSYSAEPPAFYSQLARSIDKAPSSAMPASQWASWLDANAAKMGVKKDEVEWTGVREFLAMRGKERVTRDELAAFVRDNGVRVEEVVLGDSRLTPEQRRRKAELAAMGEAIEDDADLFNEAMELDMIADGMNGQPRGDVTKYSEYTVPGGSNYREVLITLPGGMTEAEAAEKNELDKLYYGRKEMTARQRERRDLLQSKIGAPEYRSDHWEGNPNVLAHLRVDDRTDAEGNKVLFVQEIQSDWAQKGRKEGFKGDPGGWQVFNEDGDEVGPTFLKKSDAEAFNAAGYSVMAVAPENPDDQVPKAPFVDKTESWVALAIKRAIMMAVREGHDKVAFITGQQAADLYDLSKSVKSVSWYPSKGGGRRVVIDMQTEADIRVYADKAGVVIKGEDDYDSRFEGKNLDDVIGKEVAEKIMADQHGRLHGDGLKVGGSGMRAFYDKIVPQVADDVLKKIGGGKVEEVKLIAQEKAPDQSNTGRDFGSEYAHEARNMIRELGYDAALDAANGWRVNGQFQYPHDHGVHESLVALKGREIERYSTQPGFSITPKMRETLEGGAPLFSQEIPAWISGGPAALQSAAGKINTYAPAQPLREKARGMFERLRKSWVQGLVDAYSPLKTISPEAYVAARMVKSGDGVVEAMLMYGKPKMDADGAISGDLDGKGFLGVMQDLAGEHDRFMLWLAGNRAARLAGEGRENLFTPAEIAAMQELNRGQMADGSSREQLYLRTLAQFNDYGRAVLDVAQLAGLIDAESRATWENEFYVPFYRVMDEADRETKGPGMVKGLVRQKAFERLKGGKENLGDLLENTLRNWQHLINASLANQAAGKALTAAAQVGAAIEASGSAAQEMAKSMGKKGGAVYFMDGGAQRWFVVDDPFVLDAITAMEAVPAKGLPMDVMRAFKNVLTMGTTIAPAFKVRNLMRDTVAAIGQNEMSYNAIANLAQGWRGTDRKSDDYAQMMFGGALMRFGNYMDGTNAEHVKRLIESGLDDQTILDSKEKVKLALSRAWDWWQEAGDRMENINRAALYQQLRAAGQSQLQASFAARDMMDFSLQGSWTAVRFLTQVVPFLNARLQGLYKLGRAGAENPRRLGYVLGAVVAASWALLLAYQDDEDWKRREDWDRDNFWWFKIGDTAYRIPKPFEVGAIGTIAERSLEMAISDEMTGRRFADRMKQVVASTFELNPVPQMFKPMLDVYANRDSFTGRDIETVGMERLSKGERAGPNTSLVARTIGAAGEVTGLSPVQIDHLVRAYAGWMGTQALWTVDMMAAPFADNARPAPKVDDFLGGFAKGLPQSGSRYLTEFYEQSKEIQQVMADIKLARETGEIDKARELMAAHRVEIAQAKLYSQARTQIGKINDQIKTVRNDARLDGAKKRELMEALTQRKNALAERVSSQARRQVRSMSAG